MEEATLATAPDLDRRVMPMDIHHILIPTDFSAPANQAVTAA
jgi:hypothetical protein